MNGRREKSLASARNQTVPLLSSLEPSHKKVVYFPSRYAVSVSYVNVLEYVEVYILHRLHSTTSFQNPRGLYKLSPCKTVGQHYTSVFNLSVDTNLNYGDI